MVTITIDNEVDTNVYVNNILKTGTKLTPQPYIFQANAGDIIKLDTIPQASWYVFTGYYNHVGLTSDTNPYTFTVGTTDVYIKATFSLSKGIIKSAETIGALLLVGLVILYVNKDI